MALSDYWWIALLFIGLQPVIRQKALEARPRDAAQEVYDLMRLFPQPHAHPAVGRVRAPPVHATGEAVTGAWRRGPQRVPRIAATTDAYVDRSTAVSDA